MAATRTTGSRRPETLLHQSGEPVFLLGPAGPLLYVNPAWEELTGMAAAEAVGRLPGAEEDGPGEPLECFRPPPEVREGRAASASVMVRRLDGGRLWRRVEFWPLADREGRPLFVLGLVRPSEAEPLAPESPTMGLRAELWRVRDELAERFGTDELIGRGPVHRRLLGQVEAAAVASVPVLIVGPPGSGKRQVARAIHRRAGRPAATLLPIDCAALPAELLERELFGTRLDGPPAALSDRHEGGALLLKDLLDLPRDLQQRLADALDDGRDARVRVLATTQSEPDEALREDRLRPDLYYAITALVIRLAPLRERLDELPLLAQHFLDRTNRRGGPRRLGFRPEAIDELIRYDWPGNLRELSRVVEQAHARAAGELIGPDDLPATIRGALGGSYLPPPTAEVRLPLDEMLERLERRLIERALKAARGNKSLAAKMLQVSRARLHRRIQELDLQGEPEPEPSAAGDGPPA